MDVEVMESAYTISGNIIVALRCEDGPLKNETIVCDENQITWKVKRHIIVSGTKSREDFFNAKEKEHIFMFHLECVGQVARPVVGSKLKVIQEF